MPQAGALLAGKYRLERRIGAGGMGQVWLAVDERLDREVAVKVMRPELLEDPGFRRRFRIEAQAMAKIAHPGVVTVHDLDDDGPVAFLVMELVRGESLAAILRREHRVPASRTMALTADAAEALHAAHERGIIHRDVKPANLLIRPDGAAVLTDFGIARLRESTQLTATGMLFGTLSYLAPEQVLGEPATAQSDVYALGVVAYECLTGDRPFDRDNPAATMLSRVREAPPTLPATVPLAVCEVLERALATDPGERWASALDLAAACRRTVRPPAPRAASAPIRAVAAAPQAHEPAVKPIDRPARVGPPRKPAKPALRLSPDQPSEPWRALGIDPIMIAIPGREVAGYTLRTSLSVLTKAEAVDQAPAFLSRDRRLQLFATPQDLVAYVRSGEPHDLTHRSMWQRLVRSVRADQVVPAEHDCYELDLVVTNLQGGPDAWDPALIVPAGELARDLGHALRLQKVTDALRTGSPLDELDDALRAAGAGAMFARRRLRRFDDPQLTRRWRSVIRRLCDAIDWHP